MRKGRRSTITRTREEPFSISEAQGETSKQGVPLNPLNTVTPEELAPVLETLIGGLPLEKKLLLAVSLFKEGLATVGRSRESGRS